MKAIPSPKLKRTKMALLRLVVSVYDPLGLVESSNVIRKFIPKNFENVLMIGVKLLTTNFYSAFPIGGVSLNSRILFPFYDGSV